VPLPAHDYLDRLAIPYRTASFPPATEKGAANVARALGFREGQMVKTLLFETDRGERALVLVPADKSAVSALLKKALGSRNVRLTSPAVVKETTGYEIGSVPPFHWQPEGFRTLLDAALLEEELLGVGAGEWGNEILIAPSNLARACNATVVNLTRAE
jgi:Cys-tRNA(Pro)/Cys-tRNA(Cys) deacylase